ALQYSEIRFRAWPMMARTVHSWNFSVPQHNSPISFADSGGCPLTARSASSLIIPQARGKCPNFLSIGSISPRISLGVALIKSVVRSDIRSCHLLGSAALSWLPRSGPADCVVEHSLLVGGIALTPAGSR